MDSIKFKPIGIIHSSYKDPSEVPRPSDISDKLKGQIEIYKEYVTGLMDLDGFSHIIVIFNFHLSENPSLIAHPPMDNKEHGVFATHSPFRPNSIGLTIVRLENIEDNILNVSGIDMVEGTPVLDIKPYIPKDISAEKIRVGWLENVK